MGAIFGLPLLAFFMSVVIMLGVVAFICGVVLLIVRLYFRRHKQPKSILFLSIVLIFCGTSMVILMVISGITLVSLIVSSFVR